jgi:hypothetical protein
VSTLEPVDDDPPAGEASPETLRRLEASLQTSAHEAPEPRLERRDSRQAMILLAVMAAAIVAGAISLALLLL